MNFSPLVQIPCHPHYCSSKGQQLSSAHGHAGVAPSLPTSAHWGLQRCLGGAAGSTRICQDPPGPILPPKLSLRSSPFLSTATGEVWVMVKPQPITKWHR